MPWRYEYDNDGNGHYRAWFALYVDDECVGRIDVRGRGDEAHRVARALAQAVCDAMNAATSPARS